MDTSRHRAHAGSDTRARSSKAGGKDDTAPLQPSLTDDAPSRGSEAAASLTADAKEAALSATRAVKQQASALAADVGHELAQSAETQKMRGVEAIQGFARAISSAAAELESQSPTVARSARDVASKVEGLSHSLGNHRIDHLMRAATDLARSQPLLFIGGAVAAGFALSRFLKSSASSQPAAATAEEPHFPTQS